MRLIREWRNWIREDPFGASQKVASSRIGSLSSLLSSVSPILRLVVLGCFLIHAKIDEEFRKAWLPYFCRSGQRDTRLEEFDREVEGWLLTLPVVLLPRLTGQMLADVVQRKECHCGWS